MITREVCKPRSRTHDTVTNPKNPPGVNSARVGAWRRTRQEKAVWSGYGQSTCRYLKKNVILKASLGRRSMLKLGTMARPVDRLMLLSRSISRDPGKLA